MNTSTTPRDAAAAVFSDPVLPAGADERFVGFGVMGLPFRSGHYLGLRAFPAASFAPAYRSVWHRDPAGTWTFYATTPGPLSCARYFSTALGNDPVQCPIDMVWTAPWSLRVTIPGRLDWQVHIRTTAATRAMTAMAGRLPTRAWTNRTMLNIIGRTAGPVLNAGRLRLAGTAPNGQAFMVAPKKVWAVATSRAVLDGTDLGDIGPLAEQDRLGDFRLPQRGLCVLGDGHFETYDLDRHHPVPLH